MSQSHLKASEQEPDNNMVLSPDFESEKSPLSPRKKTFMDRLEEFITHLSTKNNFWHSVCSWIWLPFAFSTGLRIQHSQHGLTALLPFRRFNKNWYSAMAGAVLLANSEVAGGTYLFKECQGRFRIVCKKLEYKFLRPCIGPALYRFVPREDLQALMNAGKDFNVTLDMIVSQVMRTPQERERRVGKCTAVFHAEPIDARPRKATSRFQLKTRKKQS